MKTNSNKEARAAMKTRRIMAVLKKQINDTLKNKTVLIQFIMFPLMALIMTNTISANGLPATYFVTLFATMYVGMAPMTSIASIIAEEKENNTLRVLLMSNVKPTEYLLGVGIYIFGICSAGAVAFGLIGGFLGAEFVRFVLILMVGIITSILIGSAIGMMAKNQMGATSIASPVMMVFSFLPMISMFNESVGRFSKIIYTQQINYLVSDLSVGNFRWDRFAIIGGNMVVYLGIFMYAYRKKGLE